MKTVWQSIRILAILSLLTGLIYPLAMTGVARMLFPDKANGSIIRLNGRPVGSELIGQNFVSDRYFWPRPSAVGYNPGPSGGTNLGPISAVLHDSIMARAARFGAPVEEIPPDLLEASASGLDPHITPRAAHFQIDRIIRARNLDLTDKTSLLDLIDAHVEYPIPGFLGEPGVNVLKLNLALDSMAGATE